MPSKQVYNVFYPLVLVQITCAYCVMVLIIIQDGLDVLPVVCKLPTAIVVCYREWCIMVSAYYLWCANYLHVLLYGIEDGAGWSRRITCGMQITCRYCGMVFRLVQDGLWRANYLQVMWYRIENGAGWSRRKDCNDVMYCNVM